MSAYQRRVLAAFGYSERARLRARAAVPGLLAARPVRHAGRRAARQAPKLTASAVDGLLAAIPPYFSQDVITPDRRYATLSFGIRLMGLDASSSVIDRMRASLHPPAGVHAELVGLPVLAAALRQRRRRPVAAARDAAGRPAAVALVLLVRVPRRRAPRARAAGADRRSPPAGRRSCCSRCGCR